MNRVVGFAYAGARMQARYGQLVPDPAWQRLRRLGALDAFLQAARDTPLRPWLLQVDSGADVHRLEAQLRALFRRRVGELRDWAPPAWRPAIAWVAVLPDLPALADRLRRDETPPPEIPAGLGDGSVPLAEAWLSHWRALWPPLRPAERRDLERLATLLQDAARAAARYADAAQRALLRPLRRLFRRDARAPAGLFAYLALTWIEFAAVRGALARRRLGLPLEDDAP